MPSLLQALRLRIDRNFSEALATGYALMAITILIQLTLVPLYLSQLGKEKFGVLTLIMAATNYAAIGVTWLSGSMARILAERAALNDRDGFRYAYAFAKFVYVGYALLALSLFWLSSPWLIRSVLQNTEAMTAIALGSVYLVILFEYNADRLAFMARHRQAKGNRQEVAGQIVFAGMAVAGLMGGIGLPGVVAAQIAGITVTRWLALRYWRKDGYGLRWCKPSAEICRELWQRVSGKMGREYALYGVLVLTLQADVLLIGWLAGTETAATYYLLWRIPEVCILLLWRIPGSYAPHFIAMDMMGEHERLYGNYRRGALAVAGLAGIAATFYGLGGNWMVHLWVGNHAPEGHLPYLLAALALFFIAVSKWSAETAYALVNTRPLVRIAGLELVAKWLLIAALFSWLGHLSPLVAISASHAFGVFYLYLKLGRDSCAHAARRAPQSRS